MASRAAIFPTHHPLCGPPLFGTLSVHRPGQDAPDAAFDASTILVSALTGYPVYGYATAISRRNCGTSIRAPALHSVLMLSTTRYLQALRRLLRIR
jgi:hypothetical protein